MIPDLFGIASNLGKAVFGAIVVGGYYLAGGALVYSLFRRRMKKDFKRMSLQFGLHTVSFAHHGRFATEDGAAAAVTYQVRVDNALVQYLGSSGSVVILSGA